MLRATVSGSFHRHMCAIYDAVGELRVRSVEILSPSDPRVVDCVGEFLFVASDKLRSIKLVQDRHLEAIKASDFLWVVCPDGYTGASTCLEIGAAQNAGVPVYSSCTPADITIAEYVQVVSGVGEAIADVPRHRTRAPSPDSILIDPGVSIDFAINDLDRLRPVLAGRTGDLRLDAERALAATRDRMKSIFST